ncbi:hypothetical protein [Serratia marcescens]|uniref:Uncharacterized protein n=1 Tax=Serratia marcescens TaxID=615 RepID=A0A379YRS9_SERMA|nr:hypothetical protein [Serratia marcescens]MCC3250202.1 hypothetical protein [Serratia marcescens]WQD50673.1 hypothetical protein U0013_18875 [Serratia marcescens subsp. marcescens ATCC 13880]SUI49312.1 Uncharacterised protein [Serratia marcescens]
MNIYSPERKAAVIAKMLPPHNFVDKRGYPAGRYSSQHALWLALSGRHYDLER